MKADPRDFFGPDVPKKLNIPTIKLAGAKTTAEVSRAFDYAMKNLPKGWDKMTTDITVRVFDDDDSYGGAR